MESGWSPHLGEVEKNGIGAVWSFLVYGAAGRIIGTMDVYNSETRDPTTDELDKLSRMARLGRYCD